MTLESIISKDGFIGKGVSPYQEYQPHTTNSTAINKPWWEQSTTAAPQSEPKIYTIKNRSGQYGYDSDDDGYNPGRDQPYRTTDNTGGMIPPNWEEIWKAGQRPWTDVNEEKYYDIEEREEATRRAQESQRRLLEEIRRMQLEQAANRQPPIIVAPTPPATPPAAAAAATPIPSAPTEVPAIEDELRPLRFGPLVAAPKQ